METQTGYLSVTPRPAPSLGADFASAEPSHIHIARPSRALRQQIAASPLAADLPAAAAPELPLAPAA